MAAMAGGCASLTAARPGALAPSLSGTRSPFFAGHATPAAQKPALRRSSLRSARVPLGVRASIAESRTAGSEAPSVNIEPPEGLQSRNEEFVRLVEDAEQELQALRDRAQGKKDMLASLQVSPTVPHRAISLPKAPKWLSCLPPPSRGFLPDTATLPPPASLLWPPRTCQLLPLASSSPFLLLQI